MFCFLNQLRSFLVIVLFVSVLSQAEFCLSKSNAAETIAGPNESDGNFRALLRYRGRVNDNTKTSLLSSTGNACYTSPTIPNEIIEACNNIILSKLVHQINQTTCFSILADETADISEMEQLCVRFVNLPKNVVNQVFLQFAPLKETTGNGIANKIL